jgi:ATP-dependent Lon protease
MYSLLNGKKIHNDFAVTGEAADLNGSSGEIGALKVKFISGIKAGVKNFIYPRENERDYREFMEKYAESDLVKGIRFYAIDNIQEAIDLIIEKDEHDE